MASTREIFIPDIGDFKDVPVIELLVKPGDTIRRDDPLITLESDKATMEVPSPAAGVVKEVKLKLGDKVSQGQLVLLLEEAGGVAAAPAASAPAPAPAASPPPPPPPSAPVAAAAPSAQVIPISAAVAADSGDVTLPHASPAVRRFARELGVNLRLVRGSGPKERITREDVQAFVKQALAAPAAAPPAAGGGLPFNLPAWPQVDFAKFGAIEAQPLSRIKKISGAFLHRNWLAIPHITQHEQADNTELEAFRKAEADAASKQGVRLTLLALIMKSAVAALKRFPEFNASLDARGENLILKRYYHIGVAVDTPGGLVVPVIRDVDKKGVLELAAELQKVSQVARDQKLAPGDMQGGSFSISSLGGIGGTAFTPIINAPEVAILGVARSQIAPAYRDGAFVPRLMLPLSLSYDHRVIDGAQGARFISYLAATLADIRRVLL